MSESSEEDHLTVNDVKAWLRQELRDLERAHRLRVEEATHFVTEYEQGRLSPAEAEAHMSEYVDKWGDSPIPGVATTDEMTDREVYQKMDECRTQHKRRAQFRRPYQDEKLRGR
jgi:hypothetical protein